MNQENQAQQAIGVLIQVALLAQSKGILSLEDAVVVKQAIDLFKSPEEPAQEEVQEVVQDKKTKTIRKA